MLEICGYIYIIPFEGNLQALLQTNLSRQAAHDASLTM